MIPWLWFWAPQVHYPFSGSVKQNISPEWFFDAIPASAGDGQVEKKIFDTASYGRQLGLILEVLLPIAEQTDSPEARESLKRLRELQKQIKQIKAAHRADSAEALIKTLTQLQIDDPDAFAQVLRTFSPA